MPQVVGELLPALVDGLEVGDASVFEALDRQPVHDRECDRDGDAHDGLTPGPVLEVFQAGGWAPSDEVESLFGERAIGLVGDGVHP